jgi:hypothetical protein
VNKVAKMAKVASASEEDQTLLALKLATSQRDREADAAAKSGKGVRGGGKTSGGYMTAALSIPEGTPITDPAHVDRIHSALQKEAKAEWSEATAAKAAKDKEKVRCISSFKYTALHSAPSHNTTNTTDVSAPRAPFPRTPLHYH